MWTVMLLDLSGQPIMDISPLCKKTLTLNLNDVSSFQCTIPTIKFEQLCAKVGAHPRNVLYPTKEIQVSRNGTLKFGGIISAVDTTYDENGVTTQITADSWLQYFATRLISNTYWREDRSKIAWDAINTVQSETNGSIGVTQGNLATTYSSDLTADYAAVKDIIMNYTRYAPTPYDFEITPEKVFNTYLQGQLGTDRSSSVLFLYPDNIKSIKVPRSSDSLFNRIVGIGSGIGSARIQSIKEDATSESTYLIRESKQLYNSVSDQTTLDNNVQGYLNDSIDVLELPTITVVDSKLPLDNLMPGDTVSVRLNGSTMCDDVNGKYRISQLIISVDENDYEEIGVTFYNPDAAGSIEQEN